MPVSYTSGQTSYSRRHPTCWAWLQRSHYLSSTSCHANWTFAPLRAHVSTVWECTASQIKTPVCTHSQPPISSPDGTIGSAALWEDHRWKSNWLDNITEAQCFHLRYRHPPFWNGLLRKACVRRWSPSQKRGPRNAWVRLHTSVACFRSYLNKWDVTSSAAGECGGEEQIVDHIFLQCPVHRLLYGLHDMVFMNDETIDRQLNTCPEV